MPTVHIAYPTAVLDNIDHKIIEMWVKHQPEKLLTIPFDSKAKKKNNHSTIARRIFAVVTKITKANDLSVATPEPSETAREKDQMPTAFLIYNLTSAQQKTLLDREVWSSASITFCVTPLNLICPDFLFAIKDLFTMDKEVRTLVQNVWHNAETKTFALSLIESTPDDKREKTAKAINTFILSLRVECLNIRGSRNALKPQYNIYANGEALPNDILWSCMRNYLAGRNYSVMCGTGLVTVMPYKCTLCHSIDHPRGLCPFPNKKGWNGPKRNPALGKARGNRQGGWNPKF
jgi:hypothetical protein